MQLCAIFHWKDFPNHRREVERILSSNIGSALDEGMKEEILDACKPGDLFEGLTARHSRELYYEAHLNYKLG